MSVKKLDYKGRIERLANAPKAEIELLVSADDLDCPYFATTRLHALAAVDFALAG